MESLFESIYNESVLNEDRSVKIYYIGRRRSPNDSWTISNKEYLGITDAREALLKLKSNNSDFSFKIFDENDLNVLKRFNDTAI